MNFSPRNLLQAKSPALFFSDPAGANACYAIARAFHAASGHWPSLFTNRKAKNPLQAEVVFSESMPDLSGVDLVFTGTSHPQSSQFFELRAVQEAKSKGIYTVSFVDHWVNFRLRFTMKDGTLNIPEEVWVVDERARQLAIGEGLPEDCLRIAGNPHLSFLKELWRSNLQPGRLRGEMGISDAARMILFAPDPLSIRDGKMVAGFTEAEALQDLIDILQPYQQQVHLAIKCHPLQPREVFDELAGNAGLPISVIQDADPLELVNVSDLVIGFYSNLLLEAEVLNKTVIRYFPGNPSADLLEGHDSIPKFTNTQMLSTFINSFMHE